MTREILRSALWLGFFGIILAAWWVMYSMSTGMGLDLLGRPAVMSEPMSMPAQMPAEQMSGEMSGAMGAEGDMPMAAPSDMDMDAPMDMDMGMNMDMDMTRFGPLFGMWAVMMAAMMLPTMVPTLRAYEDLIASADGSRDGWLGVLIGYFVVWVGFAALITGTQLALLSGGVIDMMGIARSPWIAGGLLIAVGAFQFTRAKEVCHGVCHSPMSYFLGHWQTGFTGGLRMGLGLGAFCVGCCWGFMALGFVGGVMSLLWMGLATFFMVLEKLPQIGHFVTRPLGLALIIGGLGVVLAPLVTG